MNKAFNVTSLTQRLISFNTINPPGGEKVCASYLGEILENEGFKVSFVEFEEGRGNLVAIIEGRGDRLPVCLTGHMDTIPLGKEKWDHDPFEGAVEGDKLYGRGASDMKGGIAAMVLAALDVARYADRKGGMVLIFTSGEETGCQGAKHLIETARGIGGAGLMIIGEPTSNFPYIAHKGALWLDATTRGVTAHGSMPEQGVNAIYKAARAVGKLEAFRFDLPRHPLLGEPTLNIGRIKGGESYNVVPDRAVFGIDIRSLPGQSHREIHEILHRHLGGDVELKTVIDVEGISTDPNNKWVQHIFKVMGKYLQEPLSAKGLSYFTDGSVLVSALGNPPTVILGPGKPEMAHKRDEYCMISRLEDAREAYVEILGSWCQI